MTIFVAAHVRSEAKRMVAQLWSSILSKTMKIDWAVENIFWAMMLTAPILMSSSRSG